jgi:hypothetical protein
MNETEYCCCCRIHHPRAEMRQVKTRQGVRWRCLRSLEAARRAVEERDAFGREQSARNREVSQERAWLSFKMRDLARFAS